MLGTCTTVRAFCLQQTYLLYVYKIRRACSAYKGHGQNIAFYPCSHVYISHENLKLKPSYRLKSFSSLFFLQHILLHLPHC